MRRSWTRFLIGAVILSVAAGCDPAPRQSADPPTAPTLDLTASDYYFIEGRIPSHIGDLDVSQLIGADGGSLHLAGHSITVPAGAVAEPTVFSMTLLTNGYVQVELEAISAGLLSDVGAGGFNGKTVALSLTYAWASNVSDPADLVILRMHEDGRVEPLPTTVDSKGKTVTAQLDHFSRYCMASN